MCHKSIVEQSRPLHWMGPLSLAFGGFTTNTINGNSVPPPQWVNRLWEYFGLYPFSHLLSESSLHWTENNIGEKMHAITSSFLFKRRAWIQLYKTKNRRSRFPKWLKWNYKSENHSLLLLIQEDILYRSFYLNQLKYFYLMVIVLLKSLLLLLK